MEDELTKIKHLVKSDPLVQEGNIDRAIELTYKKVTEQWIRRLKGWTK